MVEIIEVKEVLGNKGNGPGAIGNVRFGSLEDLDKVAAMFNKPVIFKKEKEYYFFHDGVVYRYEIEDKW